MNAKLKDRLAYLRMEDPSMSLESEKHFVAFMEEHPDLRDPSTVLTLEGNIRARWEKAKLEFFPDGQVHVIPSKRVSTVCGHF